MNPFEPNQEATPTPVPAERLRGLEPYEPPPSSPFVELALDANEGAPPDEAILAVLRSVTPESLRRYPSAGPLEKQIADHWGVEPERVVVTSGGDDAIDRACRALLEPGRDLLTHTPSFEMIERSARLSGAGIRAVAWSGGEFPQERFLASLDQTTALVALVSPNNPTGAVIPVSIILAVARAAAAVGSVTLVDFAYIEFADDDPTPELLNEPSVVVVRTFSKAMGLAGLRVGYAIAPAPIARWLRTVGGPYPVSSASLVAASTSLANRDSRSEFIARVRGERDRLTDDLLSAGIDMLKSHANFVTLRCPTAPFVHQALLTLGISTRCFASPKLFGLLRLTLPGVESQFARLRHAVLAACAPEALLLDLDGVIADVAGSYREAIIETARAYGIGITAADVAAAKRAGDANNDWRLTQRLLEVRGATVALSAVTQRFQRVYQGADGSVGLRERESLIPAPDTLRRLARRLPLAIVTGRPRLEAEWFLRRAGITDLFRAVVCMEDAAPKPSPEPVRVALKQLGVERAWMIGDTPDDMSAARAAGVIPIGIVAPNDDPVITGEALSRSGAARVITDLTILEEML